MDFKKTFLYGKHLELKAKFGEFSNFLMPIEYEGIIKENFWTRENCSIFDTCHMGQFIFNGEKEGLNYLLTRDLEKVSPYKCVYSLMLNENGGVIDDLVVCNLDSFFLLVVNAGNREKDFMHLKKFIGKNIYDISQEMGKIDVQGPLSRNVLEKIFAFSLKDLRYYEAKKEKYKGKEILVTRTGYTGELGYELYVKRDFISDIWDTLLEDKHVKPAGLGARDTLRCEMCYPLYGHELRDDITPIEAGLGNFIDRDKDFLGRNSLFSNEPQKRIICLFSLTRQSPRNGYSIWVNDEKVGWVSSGTFSPSLNKGIGMGYVNSEFRGEEVVIKNRRDLLCKVAKKPLYKEGTLLK